MVLWEAVGFSMSVRFTGGNPEENSKVLREPWDSQQIRDVPCENGEAVVVLEKDAMSLKQSSRRYEADKETLISGRPLKGCKVLEWFPVFQGL